MTTANPGRAATNATRPAASLAEVLYGLTHLAQLSRLVMGQIASSRETPSIHIEVPTATDVDRWGAALQLPAPKRHRRGETVCTALHFAVAGWSVHVFHNTDPGGPRT